MRTGFSLFRGFWTWAVASAAVLASTLPASAQIADVVRQQGISARGGYPDLIEMPFTEFTGPPDLDWNEWPPEPTATGVDVDLPRFPDAADLGRVFRYRFVGEHGGSRTGWSVSFSDDVDCDGFSEVLVAAPTFRRANDARRDPGVAYLVSMADVEAADAADGATDGVIDLGVISAQPRSWKLEGAGWHHVGQDVASGGDANGDGCSDLLIGAHVGRGSAYVISGFDLPAADAADGAADGVVDIRRIADEPDSWELAGEASSDNAGSTVTFAGDVSGDGRSDLLIGALFQGGGDGGRGAAYLLSGAALASAGAADGVEDGRISLASVAAQPDSWKFVGENAGDRAGARLSGANLDSDGRSDIVISAYYHSAGLDRQGAVYLVAAADLPEMDRADGQLDGLIDLGNTAGGRTSWKLVGSLENQSIGAALAAGNVDHDRRDEIVVANFPSLCLAGESVSTT